MGKQWILVNIGCIECGVDSDIVGVFDNEESAIKIMNTLGDKGSWRHGGQNDYELFPLPELNTINPQYDEYLELVEDKP